MTRDVVVVVVVVVVVSCNWTIESSRGSVLATLNKDVFIPGSSPLFMGVYVRVETLVDLIHAENLPRRILNHTNTSPDTLLWETQIWIDRCLRFHRAQRMNPKLISFPHATAVHCKWEKELFIIIFCIYTTTNNAPETDGDGYDSRFLKVRMKWSPRRRLQTARFPRRNEI